MRTKKMMVKSMFISIITTGVFCFGLTACSNTDNEVTPDPEPKGVLPIISDHANPFESKIGLTIGQSDFLYVSGRDGK